MNRKILFAIIAFIGLTLSVFQSFSVGQFFSIYGDFTPKSTWTLGQPGRVLFDIDPSDADKSAVIDTDGYLSGAFWLGNVGWGILNHGDPAVSRARVLCSDDVFRDETITCPVEGYAWSQNAGWIMFSGSEIDGGSGVYYNPASGRIEGFAHNQALGWIPFYAEASTPISDGSQSGILFNGMGLNFIGRIAIIGNIAGTRIYNVTNQNVGFVFSSINHASMLNTIRKNVALISRNGNATELANPLETKFNFLLQRGSDYDTGFGGWTWPTSKKSIIVMGGDIILDQEQIGLSTNTERALIALKDENGSGGNIFITDEVKRIYSFIYAEGTVYSGIKTATGYPAPYILGGVWKIPANQLYIKGAIVSKNTVGGSLQSPSTCPVVIAECTTSTAQIYDINYFRSYDPNDVSQKSVPYDDPRFGRAATIIEYNQSLAADPPPGLLSVFQ